MSATNRMFLLLSFFLLLYVGTRFLIHQKRTELLSYSYIDYTFPSKALIPLSLDFKGILSDFLYLKMITHFGEKLEKKEVLEKRHAEYLFVTADVTTDLDPWFWDAYLMADVHLTWGFQEIEKANFLLHKAIKYRTWDYHVPYYLGFNYFYFLKDSKKGAVFLRKAAMLPDSPQTLPYLAARVSMYADENEEGIDFIVNFLKTTQEKSIRDRMKIRLEALIHLDMLEKKLAEYKKIYHKYPENLQALVEEGLISEIPKDPYGGDYYIIKEVHRVASTSNLRIK